MSSLKNQVNPIIAVVSVVVLLGLIAGFFLWRGAGPGHEDSSKPPGMPPEVAAEFQKRMGSTTATAPAKTGTVPAGAPGAGGGYIAPPGSR